MPPISFDNEGSLGTLVPKGGRSAIFRKGGSWGFLKSFTDRFKGALGPEADVLLAEENEEIGKLSKAAKDAQKEIKEKG